MTFSGKAGYNLSLEFLLHFMSQSCLSNGGKIISKTWIQYDFHTWELDSSWWWVNERYKCSKLDSGLHAVMVRLILSPLKHLGMRSYDVKTPQSFWSGILLDNTDSFFEPVIFLLLSLYIVIVSLFFFFLCFISCLLLLIKSYSFIPSINVILDAPKWKIITCDFSKPSGCLLTCVNKTTENTVVFCIKFHWSWMVRFLSTILLLKIHIRQHLVSSWKEKAEMTALSKYRGHISTPTHACQ